MKVYDKVYINGQWVTPYGKGSQEVINPFTESVAARVAKCDIRDVDAAVGAAKEAFTSWSAENYGPVLSDPSGKWHTTFTASSTLLTMESTGPDYYHVQYARCFGRVFLLYEWKCGEPCAECNLGGTCEVNQDLIPDY